MIDMELTKASGRLDILVTNGEASTVEGFDELRQRCEFKMEFFQNDWMMDLSFGVPYYGQVFKRGVDIDSLYGVYEAALTEEQGVQRVLDISIELDSGTRTMRVGGTILADSGEQFDLESSGEI